MPHPIWPFFDLHVRTPRLELVPLDDRMAVELAQLASAGVHDPAFMPFALPWTDAPSPELERNALRFHWRTRADLSPNAWNLNFAVLVDGQVAGSTGLMGHDFPTLRMFETGSWLGRGFQGKGIGKEMRVATLHLGFIGLDGLIATTSAFEDNGPSLGVTRRLGYAANGQTWKQRRGERARLLQFEMTRDRFDANVHRDDVELIGVEECLPLLGLSPRTG
jgi:RimJ/RimL family protein N-acetyltransferase